MASNRNGPRPEVPYSATNGGTCGGGQSINHRRTLEGYAMPTNADQPHPRTYLATIELEDFHSLACRGLSLTIYQRTRVAQIGDIRVHVNPGATPEAVNRWLRAHIEDALAVALGSRRGLRVDVDAAAGVGEAYLTPLGQCEQRAAIVTVHTSDSPLLEVA